MSRFLAPIHQWLFNKIQIMESIEKAIIESRVAVELQSDLIAELEKSVGPYLTDAPLADQIDHDNIHQWLQGKITVAETRQAQLINRLRESYPDIMVDIIKIYEQFGDLKGQEVQGQKPQDAETLFQLLNNYLLEGMPCDRVNEVTFKTANKLAWHTERCVHKAHWVEGGTDIEEYYTLRAAFTKRFIKAANPDYDYDFKYVDGVQYHSISKEEEK